MLSPQPSFAADLNQHCQVSVLNRSTQVQADGVWVLPNIPANLGRIRVRATCVEEGITRSGQSDYITVPVNDVLRVPEIDLDAPIPVPATLALTASVATLGSIGATATLTAMATYPGGRSANVSMANQGTNYTTSNARITTVSSDGLVTALASGTVILSALNDGALGILRLSVVLGGDTDGDGLPDDYELENGLNPNNPLDAQQDQDNDGLTTLQEFQAGLNPFAPDSDGDGLIDGREVALGTNPLNVDSDGDGVRDGLEVQTGSNPLDRNSINLAQALQSITVTPNNFGLVVNTLLGEASRQLQVTGRLIDGNSLNLTSRSLGTNYASSDLAVANFGGIDGQVFAGTNGNATITASNNGFNATAEVNVTTFAPTALSVITIPGYANNVDISGNHAYVAAGSTGLQIVDTSDKRNPRIVGALDTPGNANDIRIVGSMAYVADGSAGLSIIDVSIPGSPVLLGTLDTTGEAQDVVVVNSRAYVADGASGLHIIDVGNPRAPLRLGTVDTVGTAKGVDVANGIAVIADGSPSSALRIINVTNPASPTIIGNIDIPGGEVKDLVVRESLAYVAAFTGGMQIIDFSAPANPRIVGGIPGSGFVPRDVEVVGQFALAAEQLFPNVVPIVNVSSSSRPLFQTTLDFAPLGDYAGTGIAADIQYVYMTGESFIVGPENGTSGNTRLFIGQYLQLSDTAGIAPSVTVTAPRAGQNAVAGNRLRLEATATDDVFVTAVEFLVDGTVVGRDTTAPYQFDYRVSAGATSLTLTAQAFDLAGNRGTSLPLTVNVVPDTFPPVVIGTAPGEGVTNFPQDGAITVFFNEPLDIDSVVSGAVSLLEGGIAIAGALQLSEDRESITFTPTASLQDQTSYLIRVQNISDVFGNRMTAIFESTFTVDRLPPRVLRTNPSSGQSDVAINTPFTVEFNKAMDAQTLSPANFTIRDNVTGQVIAGVVRVNADNRSLVFTPNRPFAIGRSHRAFLSSAITDTRGNALTGSSSFSFTTGFAPDTQGLSLLRTVPSEGQDAVPINTLIMLEFSEPVRAVNIEQGIQLLSGGASVATTLTFSQGNRIVSLTPRETLLPNTNYTLTTNLQLTDLVGNPLVNPGSSSFTTLDIEDTTAPTLIQVDPLDGATNVGVNVTARVVFSERINPFTVTSDQFYLVESNTGVTVAGALSLGADGLSVTFTPSAPLVPSTDYLLIVFGIQDLAGNTYNGTSVPTRFTTGPSATGDNAPPTVTSVNPPNGTGNVPVNARVTVRFNELLRAASVGANALTLSTASGAVAGTVSLSSDRTVLTFIPTNPLTPATSYQVAVNGVTDLVGNTIIPFTSGFTTRISNVPDTTGPTVNTVSPADNATGVNVNTAIVFTFSERIDPGSVNSDSMPIRIDAFGGLVAGRYSVSGAVVTFTPATSLPGNVRVRAQVNSSFEVLDLASNASNFFQSSFVTAATPDVIPPTIIMLTPSAGSTGIRPGTQVVLTFSESLDPSTVDNDSIALFANGTELGTSVSLSADNRTLTLSTFLPAASVITVVATSGLQDLSGNRLADFRSSFSTAASFDTGRPQIVTQRPGNGASGVPLGTSIVLYSDESLAATTVSNALHVSQNGVLVSGVTTLSGSGQTIEFVPDVPWTNNALIQVFLDEQAQDLTGNALSPYQGSFRTAVDTSTAAPTVVRTSLDSGTSGLPRNVVVEIEFNESMDATTITGSTVRLRENFGSAAIVPSTASLRADRVIRIAPTGLLNANANYFIEITTDLRDRNNQALISRRTFSFSTGADSDTVSPSVVAVSPPDGALAVGINAGIRARFDEPVNPLTVSEQSIRVMSGSGVAVACTISFTNGNRDVLITPHAPLPVTTVLSLRIAGVEDRAGNPVASQTTQFTTGTGPDTQTPELLRTTPINGADSVPVNTAIIAEFNEPLDPVSVDAGSFVVRDNTTGQSIAGTRQLSSNGRIVSFAPAAPLAVGRSYRVFIGFNTNIADLAGNLRSTSFSFTTSFAEDTTAPTVVRISPNNGLSNVPTNARVVIRFDEPIQTLSVDEVTLSANGNLIEVNRTLSDANRQLTLTPRNPLNPATLHALSMGAVKDLAGNTLAAAVNTGFTTGAGVDLIGPTLIQVDPLDGATNVGVNVTARVVFSERINPFTVTSDQFYLVESNTGVTVAGALSLGADGLSVTFTPSAPLVPSTDYLLIVFGIQDLAGNTYNGTSVPTRFTTGL